MKILIGKGPSGTSYASWSKDPKHRKQCKLLNICESVWPENDGLLPWRLSSEDKDELDMHMRNVVWTHYMERLFYKDIIRPMFTTFVHMACGGQLGTPWCSYPQFIPSMLSVY